VYGRDADSVTRIASLDFLRGIAALSVALPHFFVYSAANSGLFEAISGMAVEIFFVLSGFVLAPQIMYCVRQRSFAVLLRFLARRWMRTVPPYLVSLITVSVLFGEILSPDFWRYSFYVQNLWHQSNVNDYFPIAWSLSVEEWFYVCFPLFLLIIARMVSGTSAVLQIVLSLAVVAAIAGLRALCGDIDNWGPEVRRVVVFRFDSIVYGFLLFALVKKLEMGRFALPLFLSFILSGVICLKILVLILYADDLGAKEAFPFVAAIFGMLAIASFCGLNAAMERLAVVRRIGLYLGKVSYTIYLFHLQVLYLMHAAVHELSVPLQFVIYVAAMMTFVSAFFYLFERPILAARPGLTRAARMPRDVTR